MPHCWDRVPGQGAGSICSFTLHGVVTPLHRQQERSGFLTWLHSETLSWCVSESLLLSGTKTPHVSLPRTHTQMQKRR